MSKPSKPTLDSDIVDALAAASPVEPTPDAAARMRERLFRRVHETRADYRFVHSHEGEWQRLKRGVEIKLLREDSESRSYLLRLAPGARVPPHVHAVDEECLVLEGTAIVNGVTCGTGDYHLAARGTPHDWLTSPQGCLLFIRGAVVAEARKD